MNTFRNVKKEERKKQKRKEESEGRDLDNMIKREKGEKDKE